MSKYPSQALNLAESIGFFIEYWGFKQIHGKIWTVMFLINRPVDANFLIETLGVSKALVSMSLKDLMAYDVVEEVSKKGPETQKYKVNSNIIEVITDVLLNREAKMLIEIKGALELLALKSSNKSSFDLIDKGRVQELKSMVSATEKVLQTMVSFKKVDFKIIEKVLNVKESGFK